MNELQFIAQKQSIQLSVWMCVCVYVSLCVNFVYYEKQTLGTKAENKWCEKTLTTKIATIY